MTNASPPTGDLPNLSISADVESVPERNDGDTTIVNFTVNTDTLFERDVFVNYVVNEVGGDSNVIRGLSQTATISAGTPSTQISYDLSGDTLVEPDATITATFGGASFVDNFEPFEVDATPPSATTAVIDDDGDNANRPTLSISADPTSVPEGNDGDTTLVGFDVNLSEALEEDLTVNLTSSISGNGIETSDSGQVNIVAGETTARFDVTTIEGDTTPEENETVTASISSADDGVIISQDSATITVQDDDGGIPGDGNTVYRFFNLTSGGVHLYTTDENERDFVENNLPVYDFEGASYNALDPLTGSPVYRFFNTETSVHLYTTDENERDFIEDNLDAFSFEGTAFNAYETQVDGSIPIYRFFRADLGVHFYTPSESERDFVENELDVYQSEGIAYYALPLDSETI